MSAHAATPSIRRALLCTVRRPRPAGRHRGVRPARHRATPARRPLARHARHVFASLPILLAGILTLLALTPAPAPAAVRTDVVQHAVRLQYVAPETLPAALAAPEHIDEDDPRWDCATMGNRACPQVRTDARFPGVRFHYVVQHAADGTPVATYTQRQWDRLQGLPLSRSTATDRY